MDQFILFIDYYCKTTESGGDYIGTITRTVSGRTCQNWEVQFPHKHEFGEELPGSAAAHRNYCRNPGKRWPVVLGVSPLILLWSGSTAIFQCVVCIKKGFILILKVGIALFICILDCNSYSQFYSIHCRTFDRNHILPSHSTSSY